MDTKTKIDCVFCKIISGEIPALKVYENGFAVAFLDIQPVNPGHTLIVPKEHYDNLSETPDDVLCELFMLVKKVGKAAVAATGAGGCNVGVNVGRVAGQVVMHTHVHIMPRFEGDGLRLWPKRPMAVEEMRKVAEDIKAAVV